MKTTFALTLLRSAAGLILLSAFAGCAASGPYVAYDALEVEPVSSPRALVSRVLVRPTKTGMVISGELKRRALLPTALPGEIHIEVFDSSGARLTEVTTEYHRFGKANKKLRRYLFSTEVPLTPPAGSTIRVTHQQTNS